MAIINIATKIMAPAIPTIKRMFDNFFLLSTLKYIAERISVAEITPNIIPIVFLMLMIGLII